MKEHSGRIFRFTVWTYKYFRPYMVTIFCLSTIAILAHLALEGFSSALRWERIGYIFVYGLFAFIGIFIWYILTLAFLFIKRIFRDNI